MTPGETSSDIQKETIFAYGGEWMRRAIESPGVYVTLFALVLILRSPTLFDSMYLVDEGYSGAIASEMLYGGDIYVTAVDMRPPFIYYTYYAVFLLFGQNNLWAVHVVAIGYILATALMVRKIGCLTTGTQTGGWAAVGYIVFSHTYLPRDTLAANVEFFALVPLTLSVLCFFLGVRSGKWTYLLLSGMSCALAGFHRTPCLTQMGVFAGYFAYAFLIARTLSFRATVIQGLTVLTGFSVVAAAVIGYHKINGNWEEMVYWTWTIAMRFVNVDTTVAYVVRRLFLVHGTVILAAGLIWYFGVRQFIASARTLIRDRSASAAQEWLIFGWFAVSYVTLFTGWRFPGHYHLMLMPPLALLAGRAFTAFMGRLAGETAERRRRIHRFFVAATLIPAIGFTVYAYIIRKQTLSFTPITDYIAMQTRPSDRIFVWGASPHLYSFSNRRMAVRLTTCGYLVGMFASRPHKDIDESKWVVPGSWEMLDEDFEKHPPELIVDVAPISSNWEDQPMSRYPRLVKHLEGYRKEATVNGADIYRRNSS
ncbi:MAG: hypothetical protein FJY97_01320 [candidate division Zixibacteria bacterium]|nr:hypothetical protein [candidate division Zixibacteria bacterium]